MAIVVITFPGCYHFGFNTGFNVAESTNFAVPEWIPMGEAAGICMCHPHSVRIQMNRLKSLLNSYENDVRYRETMGMSALTYSNWAKHEAKRLKKDWRSYTSKKDLTNDREIGLNPLKLASYYNKSIPVEITKEALISPKKCKRKYRRQEINEWRLAKRVKPSLFVPNAQVICMVDCQQNDDFLSDDHEFFIGTIVKFVDGYVKIHLTGLGKKDDMWLEQDSDHLFLDGGLTVPPPDNENVEITSNTPKGRNQKMK